jgi:hypothetical protein
MSWFKKITPPKPADKVDYGLGFACENGHCQSAREPDTMVRSVQWEEQICKVCGAKSFPAVTKMTQGSHLFFGTFSDCWIENSYADKTEEFVRFLDEETVRLPDETVARLKSFAARTFSDVDEDSQVSYKNGLHDGAAMTALYVLGELKEESE